MGEVKKVALVTGASKGIGKSIVHKLLSNGYFVFGLSRTSPGIESRDFEFIPTDLGSYESVRSSFDKISEHQHSALEVLVNNAGVGVEGFLEDTSIEDWHTMFNVNVHGLFYCCKLAIPQMRKLQKGHIINIASIAGHTGIGGMSGYCATKFAVKGIGQSLFKEVRKDGIKVTTIYPGSTNTNFFDAIDSVEANTNMLDPNDIAQSVIEMVNSSSNYLPVDLEVRPLKPKG